MQPKQHAFTVKTWSYSRSDDLLKVRGHLHLSAEQQIVSIIEEYLYANRYLSIISTDIRALDIYHFSYYRSLEKSGGIILQRLKLKEIIHETKEKIHSAISQTRNYDLHRLEQPLQHSQSMRAQLGELAHIEAQLQQQATQQRGTQKQQAWDGHLQAAEYSSAGHLLDGRFTPYKFEHNRLSTANNIAQATAANHFELPMSLTLIGDTQGESSVWIESLRGFPIAVKLIRRFVHFEEIDLMLRDGHKKIRHIRRQLDQGNESETYFFNGGSDEQ